MENNVRKEKWKEYLSKMDEKINKLEDGDVEKDKLSHQLLVAKALMKNATVVTHFGDDLDNRASVATLEKFAREIGALDEDGKITVERVAAGKIKEEALNVDTGGHKGAKYEDTIVIDGDPANGIKSAAQEIRDNLRLYVPEQIIECADALPTKTSIFDTKSGISLQKFASSENVLKLAENGLLTKELTDEQLEEYGLTQAHKDQQKIVDDAIEKVNKYKVRLSNGEEIVLSPEFIRSGALVAYESGIDYYASVDEHKDSDGKVNGSTFAITCKPGVKLPNEISEFGNGLVEEYKNEDGTSGVFVHPNGQMIVAGGPKNPDFKVNISQEDMINKIRGVFEEYSRNDCKRKLVNAMRENDTLVEENNKLDEKISQAKELENEVKEKKDERSIGE